MVTDADVRERVDRLLAEHGDDDMTTFLGAQFDAGLARMDYPVGPRRPRRRARSCRRSSTRRSKRPAAATRGSATPWASACAGPRSSPAARDEQQERFLRPIFTAEEIWCQLFSEPGAGSDVAGLADPRRARRRRVDRERLEDLDVAWRTRRSCGLLLARTDPDAPKHKGLTAFIIDMHQPGVEVRRIRSMAGASGFNEVFFTDANVPDTMRVGEVGDGWRVANATLMNERVSIGSEVAPQGSGPIAGAVDGVAAMRDDPSPAQRDRADAGSGSTPRCCASAASAPRRSARRACPAPRARCSSCCRGACSPDVSELVVDLMGPAGMLCRALHPRAARRAARRGSRDPVLAFVGVAGRHHRRRHHRRSR